MADYDDNLDSVLDALEDALPGDSGQEITWGNVMEYAHYLHDSEGYFIFNPQHAAKTVRRNLEEAGAEGPLNDERIRLALEKSGFEELNWLLEKTGGTQPAVRSGEGTRQARQGGWSDITGMLAASYKFQINGDLVGDAANLVPPPDDDPERPPPLSL